MGVAFALVAAVVYGGADFFGGLAAKRTSPALVVLLSQIAGLFVFVVAIFFVPGRFYASDLWLGIFGGVVGAGGIAALYAALAVGRMGVVSPITAVIAALAPVVYGIASGERPSVHVTIGIACALVAVVCVSIDPRTRRVSLREPGVRLAVASGVLVGVLLIVLARGHRDAGILLIGSTRLSSIPLLALYAFGTRQLRLPPRNARGMIVLAGALDMLANVAYILATHFALLTVAAVLTSLYPASTVALARGVLGERIARLQWVGLGLAVVGVSLISF